jgi:Tol biopolymer transport system component
MFRLTLAIGMMLVVLCAGLVTLAPGVTALHGEVILYPVDRFSRERGGATTDLHVMDLRRGQALPLVRSARTLGSPSWSPTGDRIAYSDGRLWIAGSDGAPITMLEPDSLLADATWSPNRDLIALTSWADGRSTVRLVDLAGNEREIPATENIVQNSLRWSPDGEHLAGSVWMDNQTLMQPVIIQPAIGRLTVIDSIQSMARLNAWNPTGDTIISVTIDPTQPPTATLIDLNGTIQRTLDLPFHTVGNVTWSPDGRQIAFSGIERALYRLFIYDLTSDTFITPNYDGVILDTNSPLAWSPDARQIVYTRNANLLTVDLQAGTIRQLTDDYRYGGLDDDIRFRPRE